jgi:hypothetical protein
MRNLDLGYSQLFRWAFKSEEWIRVSSFHLAACASTCDGATSIGLALPAQILQWLWYIRL